MCTLFLFCSLVCTIAAETPNCTWFEAAGDKTNYRVLQLVNEGETFRYVAFRSNFSRHCDASNVTDISIITQLTTNRLHLLEPLVERWPGPIVFVFYFLKDPPFDRLMNFVKTSKTLSRKNIMYFAVYRYRGEKHWIYPYNILRNIAFNAARTEYVFNLDADLMPNEGIYTSLLQQLTKFAQTKQYGDRKTVFIIPAFESVSDEPARVLRYLPQNKTSLVNAWQNQTLFRVFLERSYCLAHARTDSALWAQSPKAYVVDWQPEYEPYIVAKRCWLPDFDERFVGRFDKASHFYKLASEMFQLVVLPHDFLIHIPHPRLLLKEYRKTRICLRRAKEEFFDQIGFCEDSQLFCHANKHVSENMTLEYDSEEVHHSVAEHSTGHLASTGSCTYSIVAVLSPTTLIAVMLVCLFVCVVISIHRPLGARKTLSIVGVILDRCRRK